MRVLKEPEVRKNEILDAAEELFAEKGFDNTSTGDILEKCGIARGTLYYHFKSKEEILDAVITRTTENMMKKASAICGNRKMPILDRLSAAVMSLDISTETRSNVLEQMHKPQNYAMHRKAQDQFLKGIVPIISGLVDEGKGDNIFDTEYVTETVEMIMLYSYEMFDELEIQSEEQKQRRIKAFIYNTERLLGTNKGALLETIMNIFEKSINGGLENE